MKGCISDQQGIIQTLSDVFWIMQFTGNLLKNDEQHFPRTTSWRCIGKLHGRFCDTSKNHGRTGGMNNQIFEDSGKTQFVFQEIKMQLQHGRNPYIRGGSWKGTSQNGTEKDKSGKGMENPNKGQGCWEFPWVYQLLLTVVATTRWNGTHSLLTSAKLSNGLFYSGDYKRTRQRALNILSTIYIHGS